ncbi:MAG: AAA family ATPase [Kofleriaceae bacterium]
MSGTIVVLNGPSSVGKTTLARAVRDTLGPTAVALAVDDFFAFVHPDAAPSWSLFDTLTTALFASASTFARRGFDVIVDTVFEKRESLATAISHGARLVALTCPLDVLEQRERERGDREIGQARAQYQRVFQHATYELTLDTAKQSVDECVERVIAMLR